MNWIVGILAAVGVLAVVIASMTLPGCRPTQYPVAVIQGPSEISDLQKPHYIREHSEGKVFHWNVLPHRPMMIEPNGLWMEFIPDAEIKTYYVVLSAVSNNAIAQTVMEVELKDNGPDPPIPPDSDLAKKAHEAMVRLVEPEHQEGNRQLIAGVYEKLRLIQFSTLKEAREETRGQVRKAIGPSEHRYWEDWFDAIETELEARNIRTIRDWIDACKELAKGLRR